MAATNLIALTRTSDSAAIKVAVASIIKVEPHGTGALVTLMGDATNSYQEVVDETPAAILTAANA